MVIHESSEKGRLSKPRSGSGGCGVHAMIMSHSETATKSRKSSREAKWNQLLMLRSYSPLITAPITPVHVLVRLFFNIPQSPSVLKWDS